MDMGIHEAVVLGIRQLCTERSLTPNALSYKAGISQATVKSILNAESKNPGIVTLKKICDGFDITISEFFDDEIFRRLDQEIR